MKKLLLLPVALFFYAHANAQYIYKIKADSVLITNDSCSAELNLENSTKFVNGFLYNKGKGRTEFRRAMIKLTDSTYLFGGDTLNFKNLLSTIGFAGTNIYNSNGTLSGNRSIALDEFSLSYKLGSNTVEHTFPNGKKWFGNGTPADNGDGLQVNNSASFLSSTATAFGGAYAPLSVYARTALAGQFKKDVAILKTGDSTEFVVLSGDATKILKYRKDGASDVNLITYGVNGLTFPGFYSTSTATIAGLITANSNMSLYSSGTSDHGILFWKMGNSGRAAIVHTSSQRLLFKTSDAGSTPSSTVGFTHLALHGSYGDSTGRTQTTLIRSGKNGIGTGIESVSNGAVLDVKNNPTSNWYGVKMPSLSTLERDVIFSNATPDGITNYFGDFTNGSASITNISTVVIQAGDILVVGGLHAINEFRAIVVSVTGNTAVMDRVYTGTTGNYVMPRVRTKTVDKGTMIFNNTTNKLECWDGTVWQAAW